MLFAQTNAPNGWTKLTTHNDKALRVVSGAASSGGATAFSSAFNTSFTSDGTALTENQIPTHRHGMFDQYDLYEQYDVDQYPQYTVAWESGSGGDTEYSLNTNLTQNADYGISGATGGSQAHTHTMNFDVAYVDVILASKN
jgi:microcystin-dependent protein